MGRASSELPKYYNQSTNMKMNKIIKIEKRQIGENYPCFIIAEAGSNHNGSLKRALSLIDVAVEAKVDAIKFQTFKAHKIYTEKAGMADYLGNKKTIYQIIKEMEMPEEWIPQLAKYCKSKKIMFLSTPFDEESADILEKYMPVYKIASYEMTDIPLIEHIAKKGKPIILSTGTADLAEVQKSVGAISKTGNKNLVLMQCTAKYPAPLDSVNIRSIVTMRQKFNIPVGLSDHSREPDVAPMAAVALGANCIEKHFTLSNKLPGPDHKFAIEPKELVLMVRKIRQTEKALGSGKKVTLPVEQELRQFARRSVFSIGNIKKGDTFAKENIAVLRRGKVEASLHPEEYKTILGKSAKRDIAKNSSLSREDF